MPPTTMSLAILGLIGYFPFALGFCSVVLPLRAPRSASRACSFEGATAGLLQGAACLALLSGGDGDDVGHSIGRRCHPSFLTGKGTGVDRRGALPFSTRGAKIYCVRGGGGGGGGSGGGGGEEDWEEDEGVYDEGVDIVDGDNNGDDGPPVILEMPFIDESMVVVSKPSGMLVHRSRESGDRVFLLQTLRNQIGKQIFICNRLDRAVSGLMVATFDGETAAAAQACLSKENATKTYIAVVRGETPAGTFESRRPLKDQDKKNAPSREAHSIFETVATFPIEITEPFLPDLASSSSLSSSLSSSSDTESNDVDQETPALTTFTRNLTVSVIKVTIKTGRRHQIR